MDDSNNGIYNLFGIGYVPHNAVIGGNGLVIFTDSGFNSGTIIAAIEEGLENLVLDADEDGVSEGTIDSQTSSKVAAKK